jgi:hypothetical protein
MVNFFLMLLRNSIRYFQISTINMIRRNKMNIKNKKTLID